MYALQFTLQLFTPLVTEPVNLVEILAEYSTLLLLPNLRSVHVVAR